MKTANIMIILNDLPTQAGKIPYGPTPRRAADGSTFLQHSHRMSNLGQPEYMYIYAMLNELHRVYIHLQIYIHIIHINICLGETKNLLEDQIRNLTRKDRNEEDMSSSCIYKFYLKFSKNFKSINIASFSKII